MTKTILLSIVMMTTCTWPSGLAAQDPLLAPYDNPVIRLPPVGPFERDASNSTASCEGRVVRLPPVEFFEPGPPAEGRPVAAIELLGDASARTGPGPPDAALPTQPLPPQIEDGWEIRPPPVDREEESRPRARWLSDWGGDILTDYRNFYSLGNLAALGVGLGAGAAMANTPTDEKLRDFWQENVRCASTDEYLEMFHAPKVFGEGIYTLPAYGGAILVGLAFEEGTFGRGFGEWGWRSLRTVAVGCPMMLSLQYVLGASRPNAESGSDWHPFQDVHGVSGHAFMGAVPLLTAAKMVESPFWKSAFYVGSTLPGLSRINDDAHYASQVVLGWWIAFLAANAVDRTVSEHANLSIGPVPTANGVGLGLVWRR